MCCQGLLCFGDLCCFDGVYYAYVFVMTMTTYLFSKIRFWCNVMTNRLQLIIIISQYARYKNN